MSLGPGHVQRKLAEIFAESKGGALTTSKLCLLVWGEDRPKRRSAVLRAAKSAAWRAGWVKLNIYDMCNENVFVEVTNPLAGKFGGGGTSIYAIAHSFGATRSDIRGYFEGAIPPPALSVETAPKLLAHNT